METPRKLGFSKVSVEIDFYCVVDRNQYDLGALRLEREGRTYILDVVQSYTSEENNHTTITCDLAVDTETFPMGSGEDESLYNLTDLDFYYPDLTATLFIGSEYEVEPERIGLFIVKATENGYSTKAINVEIE